MVARNKRSSVRPPKGEHSETVEISLGAVIVHFGEKLHFARAAPIIDGGVQYQDLLSPCLCERLQETPYNHLGQKPDQATPIMPISAEKSINSVFSHMGGRILVYPGEDVPTHKGQLKDDSQNQ
jgi:hypothetical protein